MRRSNLAMCGLAGLLATALTTGAAMAQQAPTDPRRGFASRADLQALVDLYQKSADSPAYSAVLRERARYEAGLIRERLERGDFQVGDRILLAVAGETALSDTFVVTLGPALQLPAMRDIPLAGVLRSELDEHLRAQIAMALRDPKVTSRSLIRISVVGAVARPGFYTTPSEALVSDALMLAGGPGPAALVDAITIEREGRPIWSGKTLQQAIVEGRTLDQLNLRAGDRILVPQRSGGLGGAEGAVRTVSTLLSIPLTILALTRLF